jgi:hypothetical protein
VALGSRQSVDEHAAAEEQALGHRTRSDLGPLRQEAVEPLARRLRRNEQSRHGRAAAGADRARRIRAWRAG